MTLDIRTCPAQSTENAWRKVLWHMYLAHYKDTKPFISLISEQRYITEKVRRRNASIIPSPRQLYFLFEGQTSRRKKWKIEAPWSLDDNLKKDFNPAQYVEYMPLWFNFWFVLTANCIYNDRHEWNIHLQLLTNLLFRRSQEMCMPCIPSIKSWEDTSNSQMLNHLF